MEEQMNGRIIARAQGLICGKISEQKCEIISEGMNKRIII